MSGFLMALGGMLVGFGVLIWILKRNNSLKPQNKTPKSTHPPSKD